MFDEIRERLRGIDLALNSTLLERYKDDELQGIEYLKRNKEDEGTFLLIELGLEQRGVHRIYQQKLVRGFEEVSLTHVGVVTHFLDEMKDVLKNHYKNPLTWGRGVDISNVRSFEKGQFILNINVLGGGRYCFKDGEVKLYDKSDTFGPIPEQNWEDLLRLCEVEVLRHASSAYKGFRFDYTGLVR